MKKAIILLIFFMGAQLAAQDKSTITVKSTRVSGGVIVVTAIQAATDDHPKLSLELHCNKEASSCKGPSVGDYLMVRLPKNWGMYDCENVDLYPSSADPDTAQKIGEYCVAEK